ncbi:MULTISPECIES: DUF6204 family protein [unclassified Kitasatospora]|uniref:DUF6204 family protein n=1 Tax=unclassified Kitasatospora TaxID=2633591 RepID=UPI0037F4B3E5
MSRKTYQVITQGKFAPLDDEQRAALLAQADEHDLMKARFTEEGTVTYDRALLTFTFRVLVPATPEDKPEIVLEKAEKLTAEAVRRLGAGFRDLKSRSTDLDSIKIKRKGR